MLLWRQVAHLSLPLILICQWRLSWRRREGQREEDWGVFAPLLLHYGVIPLLKRKIGSSLNYLKPILHFTCLTGWGWGEVGRSQDRENLNKSIHAETLWPFHQFLKKRSLQHFTRRVMDGGRPEHFLCPIPLDNLADEWAPDWQVWYISARRVTRFNLLTRRLNCSRLSRAQLFSIKGTVRWQSFKTATSKQPVDIVVKNENLPFPSTPSTKYWLYCEVNMVSEVTWILLLIVRKTTGLDLLRWIAMFWFIYPFCFFLYLFWKRSKPALELFFKHIYQIIPLEDSVLKWIHFLKLKKKTFSRPWS